MLKWLFKRKPKKLPTYSSVEIAKYFLEKGPCTEEQIHNLVYEAHAYSLAFHGRRLLNEDEQPVTWAKDHFSKLQQPKGQKT